MTRMYHCVIQTCSPVHIGCDEVYEPFGFRVDDKSFELRTFSPTDFIATLDDDLLTQFSAICSKGSISSIIEVYKFIRNTDMEGRRIKVSPAFIEHYNSTLSIPLSKEAEIQYHLNRFIIDRTAFLSADSRPYIPGSSIKGSLRTAYLNARVKEKKRLRQFRPNEAKQLERTLLDGGAFSTDPFRFIKVSDFRPVGDVRTRIVYAVNEKKTISRFRARGPYQILEVIEPGSVFVGSITVETPHTRAGIERPISFRELLSSSRTFYMNEKVREDNQLKRVGINTISISGNGGECLIRLGRHSGAASVTIEGHRSIKIMKKRGDKAWGKEATTFWLASDDPKPKAKQGLSPFAWAILREVSTGILEQIEEKERLWQTEKARCQALRLEEIARQKEESLKKARELEQIQAEEERKKREEEERKVYMESLSPEERDIARVKNPGTPEQEVVEIFNRIDQFPENKKKELAGALKEYWEGMDKWTGKLSNKQKIKVRKIKEIIGET